MTIQDLKPGVIFRAKAFFSYSGEDIRHYQVYTWKWALGELALREIGGTNTFFVNMTTDKGFRATTVLLQKVVVIDVEFEALEVVPSMAVALKHINKLINKNYEEKGI